MCGVLTENSLGVLSWMSQKHFLNFFRSNFDCRPKAKPKAYVLIIANLRFQSLIIVAFFENATIEYSLESLCVSVFVCVCVCFCTITQKELDLGTNLRIQSLRLTPERKLDYFLQKYNFVMTK